MTDAILAGVLILTATGILPALVILLVRSVRDLAREARGRRELAQTIQAVDNRRRWQRITRETRGWRL